MRNEVEIGLRWLLCASLVRLRKVECESPCAPSYVELMEF